MDETKDLDQGQEVQESAENVDNPETTGQEQSHESSTATTNFSYTDSFGNNLTAEQLAEKYDKLQSEYTQSRQELSSLKKVQQEAAQSSQKDTQNAIEQSNTVANLPPEVRQEVIKLISPLVQEVLQENEKKAQQDRELEDFNKSLSDLEKKYDGKNGLPKFDRAEILNEMSKQNKIFDPEVLYSTKYRAELLNHEVANALKQKNSGVKTESTASAPVVKPEGERARTLQEASKFLLQSLQNKG